MVVVETMPSIYLTNVWQVHAGPREEAHGNGTPITSREAEINFTADLPEPWSTPRDLGSQRSQEWKLGRIATRC